MKKVFESTYQTIFYDSLSDTLTKKWNPMSSAMDEDVFKKEVLEIVQMVGRHQPKNVLDDTQNFRFTITSDLQDWVNSEVLPSFIENGIKKYAVVVSEEIFSKVSIEQTLRDQDSPIQNRYFDSDTDARLWLNEN
ncbi:hypothetical protein [Algivirga pacifica]|uniref:STAS/SEC14 domain-containing protein n=1 Tax=Algivirga pacifica TaxID=1162670 RepID=A0ABP9DDJ2_9BACT